jgi:hypothetical protein
MKNIILIIAGALVGVILFQFLFYKCESGKKDRIIADKQKQIEICLNAPVKLDTLIVRTVLTDTIYLKYTYKVTDTVKESGAIDWIDQTVEQRTYTGTYTHPQFEVNWSALVTGSLDKMTINPPSLIKSLIITKEKTVDLTQYQDCPPKERSHLYANMGGYFGAAEGIDVGLAYIRKEGWGLRGGIGTNFKGLTYNAGFLIRLK